MTALEASELLVDSTKLVSRLRGERDVYRALAVAGINYSHEQNGEIARLRRQLAAARDEIRRLVANTDAITQRAA